MPFPPVLTPTWYHPPISRVPNSSLSVYEHDRISPILAKKYFLTFHLPPAMTRRSRLTFSSKCLTRIEYTSVSPTHMALLLSSFHLDFQTHCSSVTTPTKVMDALLMTKSTGHFHPAPGSTSQLHLSRYFRTALCRFPSFLSPCCSSASSPGNCPCPPGMSVFCRTAPCPLLTLPSLLGSSVHVGLYLPHAGC